MEHIRNAREGKDYQGGPIGPRDRPLLSDWCIGVAYALDENRELWPERYLELSDAYRVACEQLLAAPEVDPREMAITLEGQLGPYYDAVGGQLVGASADSYESLVAEIRSRAAP